MYLPRSAIRAVLVVAAGLALGWLGGLFLDGSASASAPTLTSTSLPDAPVTVGSSVGPALTGSAVTPNGAIALAADRSPDDTWSLSGRAVTTGSTATVGGQLGLAEPAVDPGGIGGDLPPSRSATALSAGGDTIRIEDPAPTDSDWLPSYLPAYILSELLDARSGTPGPGSLGATLGTVPIVIPPFFGEDLLRPLPGASSRGVAFSEWESYRTDVAGRNILVTTDDSNFFRDRIGKINGNTGDTDASGLNVTDATDSVIRGSESADEAPYQTIGAVLADLAAGSPSSDRGSDDEDEDEDEDEDDEQSDVAALQAATARPADIDLSRLAAFALEQGDRATKSTGLDGGDEDAPMVVASATALTSPGDVEEWDFPYSEWVRLASSGAATAVHTDEGTTLASGMDAFVIGGDGYDDDDNRAAGENITITRDDGNVVIGGVGDVNAQIGDSEQGAVIMDVARTYIQGGGAY